MLYQIPLLQSGGEYGHDPAYGQWRWRNAMPTMMMMTTTTTAFHRRHSDSRKWHYMPYGTICKHRRFRLRRQRATKRTCVATSFGIPPDPTRNNSSCWSWYVGIWYFWLTVPTDPQRPCLAQSERWRGWIVDVGLVSFSDIDSLYFRSWPRITSSTPWNYARTAAVVVDDVWKWSKSVVVDSRYDLSVVSCIIIAARHVAIW